MRGAICKYRLRRSLWSSLVQCVSTTAQQRACEDAGGRQVSAERHHPPVVSHHAPSLLLAGMVYHSRRLLNSNRSSAYVDEEDPFTSEYHSSVSGGGASVGPEQPPAAVVVSPAEDSNEAVQHEGDDEDNTVGVSGGGMSDDFRVRLLRIVRETTPGGDPAACQNLLREAKHAREVRRVLENDIYRNPLAWDLLNGHGFRVAMIQTLTAVAPRCNAAAEWFDCVSKFRSLGFQCDRTAIAEGLNLTRSAAMQRFQADGRHPLIISDGLNRLRTLLEWSCEDRIQLDHVFFTRLLFITTTLVSFFDRQNVYRANFPEDFHRRDGVVFEWVLANSRCVDFDQAVQLCNTFVDEVLSRLHQRMPHSRISFGLTYRLMDYYFATDQPEKMLAVLEDSAFPAAESSTAKLMQLACAFNLPNVPELFLRHRALPPQCVLASPDMSRLLFYYGRSGGGKPCQSCGEPYNHRHPGLHVWDQTTAEQKRCHLLALAQNQKSELETLHGGVPQCADHSAIANQLWALSVERNIPWNALEWRGYLLCCMFGPRDTALAALALVDSQLAENKFDEFLRQTYLRVLRTHHPEGLLEQMGRFLEGKPVQRVSPIVLQEALITASGISHGPQRLDCTKRIWKLILQRDSYVVPYAARFLRRQMEKRDLESRVSEGMGEASSSSAAISPEERALLQEIIGFRPRSVNLLDLKDGVADFVVGSTKKNVFVQSSMERSKRDTRDNQRAFDKSARAASKQQYQQKDRGSIGATR